MPAPDECLRQLNHSTISILYSRTDQVPIYGIRIIHDDLSVYRTIQRPSQATHPDPPGPGRPTGLATALSRQT